jgi:chaperonin cofactor prefoldin
VKLLGIIDSIDFSDGERERIGRTLGKTDSLQRSILSSNALLIRDNDFWRKAQKNFHITGFRDGSQHGKQKVLSKALECASSEPGRAAWLEVGPIYVKAVQIYLEREVPNLHQLLRSEDFVAGPGTQTEQIFRCICRALPMHDATIDEAKELYEVWGFERTPQIEEILSSVSIRADDVRRMVAESLSTTRREIAAAVTTTRSDLMRHLERQSGELSVIATNLDALREHQSNITSQFSEIKSKEVQRPNAPPPEKESRRSQERVDAKDSKGIIASLETLQGRVDSLQRQLRDQRTRIDSLEPTSIGKIKVSARELVTTTPKQVIETWSTSFQMYGHGLASRPIESGWLLLQIIRRTRVVITDKPGMLTSLWKALPGGEIKQLVASPLWITEQDWKEGLAFLAEPDATPRLLVLLDFDVGIQETYLVPAVLGWMTNPTAPSSNRIVLVPANRELTAVSPRVLEFALLLAQDTSYVQDMERFANAIKDTPPTMDLKQTAASLVSYERLQDAAAERELRRYVSNSGVSLPTAVAENFISLYEGLQSFLSATDSALVAQAAVLLPWVRASRGETVAKAVQNAFNALYAG